MKAVTKREAETLAQTKARTSAEVQAVTLADLDAMDWQARRAKALALAHATLERLAMDEGWLAGRWEGSFKGAFVDAATTAWGSKLRERATARRAFRSACAGITPADAAAKATALLEAMHLRGLRVDASWGGVSATVTRPGWALEARLYVRFESDPGGMVANPDDATQRVWPHRATCTVSWSSTERTIEQALTAVTLYRDVTEAAAEVMAMLAHEHIVTKFGFPEPEANPIDPATGLSTFAAEQAEAMQPKRLLTDNEQAAVRQALDVVTSHPGPFVVDPPKEG